MHSCFSMYIDVYTWYVYIWNGVKVILVIVSDCSWKWPSSDFILHIWHSAAWTKNLHEDTSFQFWFVAHTYDMWLLYVEIREREKEASLLYSKSSGVGSGSLVMLAACISAAGTSVCTSKWWCWNKSLYFAHIKMTKPPIKFNNSFVNCVHRCACAYMYGH